MIRHGACLASGISDGSRRTTLKLTLGQSACSPQPPPHMQTNGGYRLKHPVLPWLKLFLLIIQFIVYLVFRSPFLSSDFVLLFRA